MGDLVERVANRSDPERIWLQAAVDACPNTGRQWCEDKVWPDDSDDSEPTEYVRADLCRASQSASDARVEKFVEVLAAAHSALSNHACHIGISGCRRSESDCNLGCGFEAGNAMKAIRDILEQKP